MKNERFGRLLVISDLYKKEGMLGNHKYVRTICDCGNEKEVRTDHLLSGRIQSCNCFRDECRLIRSITHGLSKHPLSNTYKHIKSRCYNERDKAYYRYGGIGVRMCDEWKNDFMSFYNWCISNGWQQGLHLDKDKLSPNKKGGLLYSPEYCCFLTIQENNKYRRNQFSESQVKEIRTLYDSGNFTFEKIGDMYNVWGTTIHAIVTRKNFAYVD